MQRTPLNRPLDPDPLGDALADCYAFLLRRLAEKNTTPASVPTSPVAGEAIERQLTKADADADCSASPS